MNGENVNGVIRNEEVGNMASATSIYPVVRTKLVELQRQLAARENVIMDGRDIGTVVLPDANVKIYLTASARVRAQRRFDKINVGCTVKLYDEEFEEEIEYKIVGSTEANSLQGKISNESPVGKALIGASVGQEIEVETQMGIIKYKVLGIERSL